MVLPVYPVEFGLVPSLPALQPPYGACSGNVLHIPETQGDFFGEISLIDGEPQTATVIAETDMTILLVHSSSFDHLLNTVPGLQKKIMVSLCKHLRRAEKGENR